ncbi:hypothetical protein KB879_33030 (plasmid) [Cupriavidus sp. KK10]|uniref:hypothetical protein n=1 Tax=Cupriavidus sp. KK10 TaxID=1478019 RepID=UPI001BAB3589|nr:hypothetical protein [Cupriavidus sp. KK10]QUN32476.1 hypothetical protein KB879_33030 [Cupriavidus sp. KK10]
MTTPEHAVIRRDAYLHRAQPRLPRLSLVGGGLLERRSGAPAKRHTYPLTEKGRAFFPVYVALKSWAYDWSGSTEGVVMQLFDARSGPQIRSAPLVREDGSEIVCDAVVVRDRRLQSSS